ncbi:MAG: MFS transporter [Candidatus Dormibacteria bacterium]
MPRLSNAGPQPRLPIYPYAVKTPPPEEASEQAAGRRWTRFLRLAVVDLRPLRQSRDFRVLWTGQLVAGLGAMVTYVAVPFQVYRLTHSTLAVGLVSLAELVPLLVMGLAGGLLADARDRRVMTLGSEAGMVLVTAGLLANSIQQRPSLPLIFVLAAASAALYAIQRPSLDAMLPRLVDADLIPAASALNSIRGTAGMVLGPALAGVVIATAGLRYAYAVDLTTLLVSVLSLAMMRPVPPPPRDALDPPGLNRLLEGFRYAGSRQELVGTYLVDIAAMLFGMPTALFPAIADRLGGARVLGLLYAAPALGALVFSLTSGWTSRVHRHGLALVYAASGWGLAVVVFGLVTSVPLALLALAVAGGADMLSGLFRQAIWGQTIPDRLRGRLAGIEFLSYTTGPALGGVESGLVAAAFGVQFSVVSGGVLCVIGVLGLTALLPRFRRYDYRVWKLAQAATTS